MKNISIKSEEYQENYLLFDVETTGLPKKRISSISDYDNWPNIVQIAWGIYNKNGKCLKKKNCIIKPVNFTIPEESTKIHRITQENAEQNGELIHPVLVEFSKDTHNVGYLIAHNLEFDYKVVACELIRNNISSNISKLKKICTMQCATDYCRIGELKYRRDRLESELNAINSALHKLNKQLNTESTERQLSF